MMLTPLAQLETSFQDTHAKILQVRTNPDIFMVSTMSSSWQDLPRFSMFLMKVYPDSVHWAVNDICTICLQW